MEFPCKKILTVCFLFEFLKNLRVQLGVFLAHALQQKIHLLSAFYYLIRWDAFAQDEELIFDVSFSSAACTVSLGKKHTLLSLSRRACDGATKSPTIYFTFDALLEKSRSGKEAAPNQHAHESALQTRSIRVCRKESFSSPLAKCAQALNYATASCK
jgi:hypothetical protein